MTTIFDRADVPTATVHEHRMGLFDPTRRPKSSSKKTIKTFTKNGDLLSFIVRNGRLGQAHADVLDAIFYCAEKRGLMEDGRIKLLVDPAKVRRIANIRSGQQFTDLVRELESAVIEVREPIRLACIGHLIDHIDTARKADGTPITRVNPGLTNRSKERVLWRVEIGKALCKFLDRDIWRTYNPAPLARFPHGITQAIARYVLTHHYKPKGGWRLDTLIRCVAGDISKQALWDRRREFRQDAKLLAEIGVVIENDRVRLEQKPEDMEQKPRSMEQKPEFLEQKPEISRSFRSSRSFSPTAANAAFGIAQSITSDVLTKAQAPLWG